MISTDSQLAELLPHLVAVERVALDTEADSLHVYREKLCLIQLSLPGEVHALIDPLGDFSLAPFYAALKGKVIVLHGADYDLRLLRRASEFVADAVFDTMLAARLVGRREFSYAALVAGEFGVTLTKGSQKANWARRPLTATMAVYAQNDTRYLLALAERLEIRLRELARWSWFEQSCTRALAQAAVEKERDGEDAWRITGSGILRGLAAAIFREMWHWRDREARQIDRPSFHILRNDELLSAAKDFALGNSPRFDHLRGSRRDRLFAAVERARALPESEWPVLAKRPFSRWTAQEEKRAAALKAVRDKAAADLDLDPSIIAARATLETLAVRPETAPELLMPWQRELLEV